MFNESGFTFSRLIVAAGKSDLRRGVDGLAAMVKLQYNLDPMEKDTLFLFCGNRRDRIKGLLWTGDRFILLYIRLADGHFKWPRSSAEARELTGDEFMRLMDGFTIDPSVGKKREPKEINPKDARKKNSHFFKV